MSDLEIWALEVRVALNPESGDIIPKSGGMRKLRVAAKGHGRRGGARVIYYWYVQREQVRFLDFYAKNEQEDLSQKQLKKIKWKI